MYLYCSYLVSNLALQQFFVNLCTWGITDRGKTEPGSVLPRCNLPIAMLLSVRLNLGKYGGIRKILSCYSLKVVVHSISDGENLHSEVQKAGMVPREFEEGCRCCNKKRNGTEESFSTI